MVAGQPILTMYSDEKKKRAIELYRKEQRLNDALGFMRYLKRLNPTLAEIYWRFHWKGESVKIIAKVLEFTESQIRYKLKIAQKYLDSKREEK